MSDLGGGRASNGGARTGGPVPVSSGAPSGVKTPTAIMRDRRAREERRQEEAKAEEFRRIQEERRKSAERRGGGGGSGRHRQDSAQYQTDDHEDFGRGDGYGGSGQVASGAALGEPTGRMSQDASYPYGQSQTQSQPPSGKMRVSSAPQPSQTRSTQPTVGSRRTQASQSAPRQASSSQQTGAGAPTSQQQTSDAQGDGGQQRNTNASSFPHAFERWEQLSSHWEGLTSYWLRKLEQNTEELGRSLPSASSMSRQITDLSAAGANLFHAVVELQRLRASSERKFQRWFFETRADNEKNAEIRAQLESQLQIERSAREQAAQKRNSNDSIVENARREVAEMRRELNISKEEARRAWEELGRRNQEAVETGQSLKEGRITVVSGVQVVPYFAGPSRTGSSNRPATREGQHVYGGGGPERADNNSGGQQMGDEREYYQQQGEPSPTNTDPFTESGRQQIPLHHESGVQSLASGTYQPYPLGSTPATSGTSAQTVLPAGQQRRQQSASDEPASATSGNIPISSADAQRFYQHTPQETSLHSSEASGVPERTPTQAQPPQDIRSEPSYVGSVSEPGTEFAQDQHGNIRYDASNQPTTVRRPSDQTRRDNHAAVARNRARSQSSDDYDTEADIRREREHAARYGTSQQQAQRNMPFAPDAPTIPSTSAEAMQSYSPPTSGAGDDGSLGPDYEGQGYGGWETLQTRHHHPTRLSDVLEEDDDERSSRATRMGD
ncbi:hypothetical protein MBLNU230_g6979t1 [Neophaeotheca triangularis]